MRIHAYRRPCLSSRASSASFSDEDAITPLAAAPPSVFSDAPAKACPVPSAPPMPIHNAAAAAGPDTAHIWRRMLALQRRYHCYNSARISAALDNELVEAVVPPRACLDLLNDVAAAQMLPDEARAAVAALVTGCDGDEVECVSSVGSVGVGGGLESVQTATARARGRQHHRQRRHRRR